MGPGGGAGEIIGCLWCVVVVGVNGGVWWWMAASVGGFDSFHEGDWRLLALSPRGVAGATLSRSRGRRSLSCSCTIRRIQDATNAHSRRTNKAIVAYAHTHHLLPTHC
ncbi:hypothetical protein EV126DRAFT_407509 [Verticillium dahliae]|nr:hypothetical protein EV126DRAFT_407509 [Verticillium dahliae]